VGSYAGAAGCLLVALGSARVLFLRAKHLFIAAIFTTTTNPPSISRSPCSGDAAPLRAPWPLVRHSDRGHPAAD